jgi:DNA-binding protein Fis
MSQVVASICYLYLKVLEKEKISQEVLDLPDVYNLDEINLRYIERVLQIADGKIHGSGGAAELMGINPNTLRNKMNKLGIDYKKK